MIEAKKGKAFIWIIMIIIICLLIAGLLVFILKINKPIYSVKSRTEKQEAAAKNNPDKVVGWIKVQGTNIDYPIIYNDYKNGYRLDQIEYSFAWINSDVKELTNRPVLYGHNLQNVSRKPLITAKWHSRFEQLLSYIYIDFAKENKYIQYTINGKDYLYKIFSVSVTSDANIESEKANLSRKELNKYISKSLEESLFNFDVKVTDDDNLITLVTCTRMFGQQYDKAFKIDGRMLRKGERATNYNVSEKASYKKIKELMKGDNEDETNA